MTFKRLVMAITITLCLAATPTFAETDCKFVETGKGKNVSLTLESDCSTDETLYVYGPILDCDEKTITVNDPPGTVFTGAVIRNTTGKFDISRCVIVGGNLAYACKEGAEALVGLEYSGAEGYIKDNKFLGIKREGGNCREGFGFRVRRFGSFSGPRVWIERNEVTDAQAGDAVIEGDLRAFLWANDFNAPALQNSIPTNTLQCGFGARCAIERNNKIHGGRTSDPKFFSTGVLIYLARFEGSVSGNKFFGPHDVAIFAQASNMEIQGNASAKGRNAGSGDIGIVSTGANQVSRNKMSGFATELMENQEPDGKTFIPVFPY